MRNMRSLISIVFLIYFIDFSVGQTEDRIERNDNNNLTSLLYERYQNISQAVYDFKKDLHSNAHDLAENTFHDIKKSLWNTLTKNLPSCNEEYIHDIVNSFNDLILKTNPYPCYEDMKFIDNITNELWDWAKRNVESNFYILDACSSGDSTCDQNTQYTLTESKVNEFDKRFYEYQHHDLDKDWEKTRSCYDHISNEMMNKISKIHLTTAECETMHNHEDILRTVGLWPLTVEQIVGKSSADEHQNLPEQLRQMEVVNLTYQLDNINYDVFDMKEHLRSLTLLIAEEMSSKLENRLFQYSKFVDHFPSCYKHYINKYKEKLLDMMKGNYGYVCTKTMDEINHCTDSILIEDFTNVRPILGTMNECEVDDESCQYANKRDNVTQEITEMKQDLTECRNEYVRNIENQTKLCYEDLTQRMENKLVKYLPVIQDCQHLRDEDELFTKMGLVNFSEQEFNDSPSNIERISPHPLNSTGIKENERLQYKINDFLMDLNHYTFYLRHQMRSIFNGYNVSMMTDYDTMIKKINNKMLNKVPSCFNRTAIVLRESLNHYYSDKVYDVCYNPLPELVQNATILANNGLWRAENLLRKAPDCNPHEFCDKALAYIISENMKLLTWKEYNLTSTWEYARNCLYQASFYIKYNILKYEGDLRRCRKIPFQENLFHYIQQNQAEYPSMGINDSLEVTVT